jgi:hypothetical protein
VIARIIEPSSKLDTIRILDELGLKPPSHTGIHRCLNRVAGADYRDRLSEACVTFRGVEQLTLVLHDVTTLFFQVEQEDNYRIPGLSPATLGTAEPSWCVSFVSGLVATH